MPLLDTALGEFDTGLNEYNINDRAMIKNWPMIGIFLSSEQFTPGM